MYLYFVYPKTRQTHTIVQTSILFHTELNKFHTKPYSNSIHPYFHTNIHSSILKFHSSLPVIFSFLFLLSSFRFSSSSSSFLFSSLLSIFPLSFSKTKMGYLFWFYLYLILSPFISLSKEETSPLFPSSHLSLPYFSSLFYYNIFLLLPFGPHFHFYSQFNLSKSYSGM